MAKMDEPNWKCELNRFLDVMERESKVSLRIIKQHFKASGSPFNEDFRQYFQKMSAHRLDSSYDTVLFEDLLDENQPQMALDTRASIGGDGFADDTDIVDNVEPVNAPENENLTESTIDYPIEGSLEKQLQAANDSNEDMLLESKPSLELISNQNSDSERGGEHLNKEIGIEITVKREIKVENDTEVVELPFIVFDPNANNNDENTGGGATISGLLNDQSRQPNNSSDTHQNQTKRRKISKRFKCTDCAYASQYKQNLNRHQLVHDSNAVKPLSCTHCDFTCQRKDVLKRHQKVHVQGKSIGVARDRNDGVYKCTLCDQGFTQMQYLSYHMTTTHKNNQRLFNCERCMDRFEQQTQKNKHELHCKGRRYECYLCKKYVAKKQLRMQWHMRTHISAMPFQCSVCNKKIRYSHVLKRHLDTVHGNNHK